MVPGERLSSDALAQAAREFSGQARTLLTDVEALAVAYPKKNLDMVLTNLSPGLSIALDQNVVSVSVHQFNMASRDVNRYLPELPRVDQIDLSASALVRRPRLRVLYEAKDKGYFMSFNYYQMEAAVAVAQYELDEELTLDQGGIISANRLYKFDRDGSFEKSVTLTGFDDFINPAFLTTEIGNTATFDRDNLPIRAGEIKLVGTALSVIRDRLVTQG